MSREKIWKNTALLLAGCCVFAAWGMGSETTQDIAGQASSESVEETGAEADVDTEIEVVLLEKVDYPFSYGEEDWRLYLCTGNTAEGGGSRRFLLYDGDGELLQDFPCAIEADELVYCFDNLCDYYGYSHELIVFPTDAEENGGDGLLFSWDDEEDRFVEEPIVIPWYEEVRSQNAFLVTGRDNNVETNTIYRINDETRQLVELRRWEREGEHLQIRDCLSQAVLYDGKVEWSVTGELANNGYYEDLFWRELKRFWNYTARPEIPTGIIMMSEDGGYDDIDEKLYDNREELLADCGFLDAEPFYQYYDRVGNLELELFFDESADRGCGILYSHRFNYELEEFVWGWGFVFEGVSPEKWVPEDTFSILSYRGKDARDTPGYSETYKYTEDGRLSSYEADGYLMYEGGVYWEVELLSMSWVYRNDGTLFCKDYSHNDKLFSTTESTQRSYYDELGRLVYRNSYITHGSYYYYYTYEDEGDKPAYCLELDDNMGILLPKMVVFH